MHTPRDNAPGRDAPGRNTPGLRVTLASMPWQSFELPSLPLALLKARLAEVRPADTVGEYHGYLRWAEHVLEETGGEITPATCERVSVDDVFHGIGDWIFAGALYDDPEWRAGELESYAARARGGGPLDLGPARRMRPLAAGFIDLAAAEILAGEPDVVGLTSTFMQNVASLALARRLKELAPGVAVVIGGSNCDGAMGHALHRNHPFVDYVVRGEGEVVFPELLDRIRAGNSPEHLPGVCWWKGEDSVANEAAARPVPPMLVPRPDFDGWQQVLDASPVRPFVEPKLLLEGSRGCWWGEKHQCTFCGLNGSSITFRSRPAERFRADIDHLVKRHRILDVITVDNIMDMSYFRDLLPGLAASGWDLRIHYEVKANLRADQLRLLADAGVHCVQPGIESLSTRVLELMDKGTTATINVRMLRDCEAEGITTSWNHLCGFPGETDDDYLQVIEQMPALVHLQPPGSVGRILLERFSPYFERPELGFAERRPHRIYDHVYDLPEEELNDLVYLFDTPPAGISGALEKRLQDAAARWRDAYPESTLVLYDDAEDGLRVEDRRVGWPRADHVLTGWEADAYRALERGRTAKALIKTLAEDFGVSGDVPVEAWLQEQVRRGLLFRDGPVYLALASRGAPVHKVSELMEETSRWRPHV
ncbi:RiPP maturation radical SAM C-methyltransferase [Actinomadura rugatobispora]|uniref:RiPP maturation radical SAM C-methyltransferase n=1 Tax=Actinomadura rugatobispora TaxID=1994 RepID=A0ABW1ACV6_9ACTN